MDIGLIIVIVFMIVAWVDHEASRRGHGYGASVLFMLTAIAFILLFSTKLILT